MHKVCDGKAYLPSVVWMRNFLRCTLITRTRQLYLKLQVCRYEALEDDVCSVIRNYLLPTLYFSGSAQITPLDRCLEWQGTWRTRRNVYVHNIPIDWQQKFVNDASSKIYHVKRSLGRVWYCQLKACKAGRRTGMRCPLSRHPSIQY